MAKRKNIKRTERVNELKAEYKKLATTANWRMLKLERLAENPEYKSVLGYAYKNVMHDLKSLGELTKGGRFSMDIIRMSADETDIRHLTALVNTARSFLDAPSSTIGGIHKIYGKRAKTLNKKYGTDLSAGDMKTFFESAYWEKLKDKLGSQTAMIVIGQVQKKSEDVIESIDKSRSQHKKIDISSVLDTDGLDTSKIIDSKDTRIIEHLARIYERSRT